MQLALDQSDPTPLHAQLERAIRVAIATGRLPLGERLPTVRQLAVDLRVNANTVARVYLALEREGVLATKRGVGTFVAEMQPRSAHAAHATHRERQMRALTDRYLADTHHLGFTPREVLKYLASRIQEGE